AILAKDLRIEWRTREGISSVFVLGVLLVVVLTMAHDPSPETAPTLAPGVLRADRHARRAARLPPRARERLPRGSARRAGRPGRDLCGQARRQRRVAGRHAGGRGAARRPLPPR